MQLSIKVNKKMDKFLYEYVRKRVCTCILCVQYPAVRCSSPRVRRVAAAKVLGSGLNNEGFMWLAIFVATYPGWTVWTVTPNDFTSAAKSRENFSTNACVNLLFWAKTFFFIINKNWREKWFYDFILSLHHKWWGEALALRSRAIRYSRWRRFGVWSFGVKPCDTSAPCSKCYSW